LRTFHKGFGFIFKVSLYFFDSPNNINPIVNIYTDFGVNIIPYF